MTLFAQNMKKIKGATYKNGHADMRKQAVNVVCSHVTSNYNIILLHCVGSDADFDEYVSQKCFI